MWVISETLCFTTVWLQQKMASTSFSHRNMLHERSRKGDLRQISSVANRHLFDSGHPVVAAPTHRHR